MAIEQNHIRSNYQPLTEDPNIRMRLNNTLDKKANIPIKISSTYPQRGDDLYIKTKSIISQHKDVPILIEPTILTDKVTIDDMLVVMCSFGSSPSRITAMQKAIELMRYMNPIPKFVMCEGSVDGQWHFEYLKAYERFDYIPVDLQYDEFVNFFCKECLWNQAANTEMNTDSSITKLVFMDADCFFVDQYAFHEINEAFNSYDVISPHRAGYYTGCNTEASKYGLLNSTGYNVSKGVRAAGYQGFSIGLTKLAYQTYFNCQLPNPSLGMGDVMYWYMLAGRKQMRGFTMLPYSEHECKAYLLPDNIRIGHANQILGHIDHGRVDERIYRVRSTLMKMLVPKPFAETAQMKDSYLVGWNHNREAEEVKEMYLRIRIENRREIKISTADDTRQYYEWVRGLAPMPPKCIMPNRFTINGNKMPMCECSVPGIPNQHISF